MEKIHLLAFVGAALVAGAASGYVAGGANKAPPPKASAEPAAADDEADDDLVPIDDGDDAAALKRRVARLEAQLAVMKKGLALAQAGGAQDPGDGTAPKPIVDGNNPVFELAVRDVMDRVQEEDRQDRQDRWRQRSNERVSSTVDTVATKVQLSASEKDKLREILLEQAEKFMNLRGGDAGAPRNRDEWRDRMGQIRTDTDAAIAQAFGAERAKSVSQALEEERPRFGRPGR